MRQLGEQHHQAKYSDATVAAARAMYQRGVVGYKRVGDALGVPDRTVMDWVRRDTRAGLTRAERERRGGMDAFLRRAA